MKNISKKTVSTLLTIALVIGLLTAAPITVSAETPEAPTNLTATVTFTLIVLVWEDNSTGEAGFEIERKEGDGDWEAFANVDADWEINKDLSVYEGRTYSYRVRAVYSSGTGRNMEYIYSEYSNTATGTIDSVPAPADLSATAGTNGITLTWTDNSSNEDGFMVIKSWADGLMGDTKIVGADVTTYVDYEVIAEYVYTYRVIAYIAVPAVYLEMGMNDLYSEHSNTATATAAAGAEYLAAGAAMSNFVKTRIYKPGIFTDVNENMWYGYEKEKAVALAYEYGLMSGSSDAAFNPTGNISIAEAVTVATRVHSFYTTGHQLEFAPTPDAPWYQGNVNYAIENEIIGVVDFMDYNKAATRAEMAYIFSRSIPRSEFASQNTVNSLPDVDSDTLFYSAILMMYTAGVVGGDAGTGAFRPDDSITRAEAAAVITRVILPSTRLSGMTY